ncbi:MAG: hypothetical protein KDC71_17080 [Acidobacteria bacterium]|nr:hypothetical protein [Acidobacteriota bacterium]
MNGVVQPFGLAVQDQQFAITERVNHQIHLFDRQGQQQKAWGGWGQGPRQMIDPLDIGTDSQKRFFLVDNGNHRLVVMDQAGNWQVLFTGGRSITPEMQALIPQ